MRTPSRLFSETQPGPLVLYRQRVSIHRTRRLGCVLKTFSKHNPVLQSQGDSPSIQDQRTGLCFVVPKLATARGWRHHSGAIIYSRGPTQNPIPGRQQILINVRYLDSPKKFFGIFPHVLEHSCQSKICCPLRNTTRSSSPMETLLLYRTRGPGCVSEMIWIVSSLFFFSFYCKNHLLRCESSKQKQNGFQNTTRCSSPIYGDSPSIQDQRTGLCFGN